MTRYSKHPNPDHDQYAVYMYGPEFEGLKILLRNTPEDRLESLGILKLSEDLLEPE